MGKNKTLTVDQWVMENSSYLSAETLKLLKTIGTSESAETQAKLKYSFLLNMVELLVQESLEVPTGKKLSKEEKYKITSRNFMEAKTYIQAAIGAAFGKALSKFSGSFQDYYAEVKPVPETKSKYAH